MSNSGGFNGLEHLFVLMLENRSFDHMLGFSGITGREAVSDQPTRVLGLTGTESNRFNGQVFTVSQPADFVMPIDPGHEFSDVLHQLCGSSAVYSPGGPYPAIDGSGFVAAYASSGGQANSGEIMKCYAANQLTVLNALAREFAICDQWYASMPGPTWPNRMFAHAASSGGLDHSPTVQEIVQWETISGFSFPHGSIFDALKGRNIARRLYAGDDFPMVAALQGIGLGDIRHYSQFAGDLQLGDFPFRYVFIEPSYDVLNDYQNGASEHPRGDVTRGEALIKSTYEAIRNSRFWDTSALIVLWDEHGGFYDHAIPPAAAAPGDTAPDAAHNQHHFTFQQYGPRVPAIVVSPLIPKNVIDHRLYDHASIPSTLEHWLGLGPLTGRDAAANQLGSLFSLSAPRTDAPATLPRPAASGAAGPGSPKTDVPAVILSQPNEDVNQGNLPVVVHSALRQDLQISPPDQRLAIINRVAGFKTRAQAAEYLKEVQEKVRPLRATAH